MNKRLQTILETVENLMEYGPDELMRRHEQWRRRREEEKKEDAEIERRARENLAKRRNVSPESLKYDDEEFEYEYEMTKGEYKRQKREAARAKRAQEESDRKAQRANLPFGERLGFDLRQPWVRKKDDSEDIIDEIESRFERKSFDEWKKDRERAKQPIDWREFKFFPRDETRRPGAGDGFVKVPTNKPRDPRLPPPRVPNPPIRYGEPTPGAEDGYGRPLPPSRRPGAGDGFVKVPYNPKRPGSNSGLVGAGNSVSGYDRGSDAPTAQPPMDAARDRRREELIRSHIERRNAERGGFKDKNDKRFTPRKVIPYT